MSRALHHDLKDIRDIVLEEMHLSEGHRKLLRRVLTVATTPFEAIALLCTGTADMVKGSLERSRKIIDISSWGQDETRRGMHWALHGQNDR